jgi:hypothetical protein
MGKKSGLFLVLCDAKIAHWIIYWGVALVVVMYDGLGGNALKIRTCIHVRQWFLDRGDPRPLEGVVPSLAHSCTS